MPLSRNPWALSALALTLVLGACSTPADLADPTLEPQFGTEHDDVGLDVSFYTSGSVFVLTEDSDIYVDGEDDYYAYQANNIHLDRYDATGRLVWSKYVSGGYFNYGSGDEETAFAIGVHSDKNGVSYVFVAESDDTYYPTDYTNRVYKYDPAGTLLRTINLDSLNDSGGAAMGGAVDSVGNVFFLNTYEGAGYVSKYSTGGTFIWKRAVNVGNTEAISVASNGSIFVTGTTGVSRLTSGGTVAWTKAGAGDSIVASGANVYVKNKTTVRKLDVNGRQLWSKTQSGLSGMVVADMTADASGNVYLTGKYSASSSNRNVFTRKLSSSGSTLFTRTFGTSSYDDARGVATINGSEIYVTGATQGSLAHAYRGGGNDGYVRKLGSTGNPVWTR